MPFLERVIVIEHSSLQHRYDITVRVCWKRMWKVDYQNGPVDEADPNEFLARRLGVNCKPKGVAQFHVAMKNVVIIQEYPRYLANS